MHVHALIDSLTIGGAENLLLDFAAGAQEAGIEVTVGYLWAHDEFGVREDETGLRRLRSLGIEPRLTAVSSLLSRSDYRRVRDDVAAVGPDVLHTHLGAADYFGSLAARSLGIPSVSTLHSAAPPDGLRLGAHSLLYALARRRGAGRVIAVSDAARRHYLRSYPFERAQRVVTVHNGVVDESEPGAGPAIRRDLGLGPDELVLATVSILKAGKGHPVAIDVVARLRKRGVPARLLVLGEGPLYAEIEREIARLDGAGLMLGHRDDVLAVLDAVDVLLHPSEADAFPGALLQALAAAVPAAATAVGGIPEIVDDGVTGVLLPAPPYGGSFLEPVAALLSDPERRREMGQAGRRRFEREFTVERWIERLLPVYDEVIAERRSATSASSASSAGT